MCAQANSRGAGYKGMNNDPNKEWVLEAKDGEQFEEGEDPFLAKSRAKKEAIQVRSCALLRRVCSLLVI